MPLYDVVGIGLAFSDIIAAVPHALLKDYGIPLGGGGGLSLADMARLRGQLSEVEYRPGGAVPNTLAGIAALGGKVGFFGKVAPDADGASFLDDFRRRGVDLLGEPVCAGASMSAVCVVLVTPDKERSMPTHRGCAENFTVAEFENFDFSTSKFLLIQGEAFSSPIALPALRVAIERAHQAGCKVVVTLSMLPMWPIDPEVIRTVIATQSDILIGDKDEAATFKKMAIVPHSPSQLFVTTKGADGAEAEYNGERVAVPARTLPKYVNALGAGDQFLAGLLYGLARDWPVEKAMRLGTNCAVDILGQIGPRPEVGQSWTELL